MTTEPKRVHMTLFVPSGGRAEPTAELTLVLMPALVALLQAAEDKKGRPLTRAQVEKLTSRAVGVAMQHDDARVLERERAYADIDPQHVWEQWQVLRRVA